MATARLYAILARRSPVAVLFRRGPSKQVLLIRWNTDDDSLLPGQWLKGRIYERRCDLSPDGDLLLYFAANWKKPYLSWSAVSRPPYLTALALWPKGDGWGGGGHWISATRVALNHRPEEMFLGPGSTTPKGFKVAPFGDHPGWGEDNPIWFERLQRDGWTMTSEGKEKRNKPTAAVWIEYNPPIVFSKPHPTLNGHHLEMAMVGIDARKGPWYLIEHSIVRPGGVEKLGRSDWADWSHPGDLLYAKDGRLFRLRLKAGALPPLASAGQIADLRSLTFESCECPPEGRRW